jgi:hypothetical protein
MPKITPRNLRMSDKKVHNPSQSLRARKPRLVPPVARNTGWHEAFHFLTRPIVRRKRCWLMVM